MTQHNQLPEKCCRNCAGRKPDRCDHGVWRSGGNIDTLELFELLSTNMSKCRYHRRDEDGAANRR